MPLNAQEEARAKEIFDALDADGSGKISKDNLKQALADAGFEVTDDEIEAVIGMVDSAGDGTISWDEFKTVVEARPIKRRIEAALRKLFEAMDTDGSGYVTASDLRNLLDEAGFSDEVSDDQLAELISKVDTAGDGRVSFEEFLGVFFE